jgi:hypothetical protein
MAEVFSPSNCGRRTILQPRFTYQPHLYDLREHHVTKQRDEKYWPIERWQMHDLLAMTTAPSRFCCDRAFCAIAD